MQQHMHKNTVAAAIAASIYDAAAANDRAHGRTIFCGADGHDGLYMLDITDRAGQTLEERHALTLDEVERAFPGLVWWPLLDNGSWGATAEEDLNDE